MGGEFLTPTSTQSKRQLPIKHNGMSFLQSPTLAALIASPSKQVLSIKTQRPEMSKVFLQANSNHIGSSNNSLHAAFKKASEGGLSLRDKIKNATGQKVELGVKAGEEKKGLSLYADSVTQYKEMAKSRRSRYSMSGNGVASPVKGPQVWENGVINEEDENDEEKKKQAAVKKAKVRTKSLDMFKNIHKNEDVSLKKLPSLLNG